MTSDKKNISNYPKGKSAPNPKQPKRPAAGPGAFQAIPGIRPPECANAQALLFSKGTRLAVVDGKQMMVYELVELEESWRAKMLWHVKAKALITHVAALDAERIAVVTRERKGSRLALTADGRLNPVTLLPGSVTEIAVAGKTVFTAITATADSTAQLIGTDSMTGLRVSTQPVQTANLNLAVSADASLMVATDRSTGRVHGIPATRNCDPGVALPPLDPPRPDPNRPDPHGGGSGYNGCGCGCCSKPDRPTPSTPPGTSVPLPDPNQPTDPSHPGGGRRPCGPGSITLPEPCGKVVTIGGRVHRIPCKPEEPECDTELGFSIGSLVRAGRFLVARSQNARRLTVIDSTSFRTVSQRSLPSEGALLASAPDSERLVVFNRRSEAWGMLDLGTLPAALNPISKAKLSADTSEITFVGRNNLQVSRSATILQGERRVLMVPIVDQGQSYNEPNMDKIGLFTNDNVFEEYKAFYIETSYGNLDMKFDFLGYTKWAPGLPIELPRKMRGYFYPPFEPGGLRATENLGAGSHDLFLDGSESMDLTIHPIEGAETDVSVPAFAFAGSAEFDAFPTLNFTGAETADMIETLGNGSSFNLAVSFPTESFAFTAGNFAARLTELSEYLLNAVNAAEDAAGVPGGSQRVSAVECRRIRRDGAEFGELHVNVRFSASGAGKARLSLSAQSGLEMIGFNNVLRGEFTIPGDESDMETYWNRALEDGQVDAGLELDNYQIAAVTVDYSSNPLTTDFLLTDEYGGMDSNISLDGTPSGLNHLGFDNAQPVDGSDTNRDDANALRDSQEMLDDVVTALIDRIGGPGNVNELDQYSSVFFAFILPPPSGLPAGTGWSVSAPDVAGLRMFARSMTARYKPNHDVQLENRFIGTLLGDLSQNGTAIHELGHSLGYADQYYQAVFRDDLLYLNHWDLMDESGTKSHMGGYHKMVSGWIPESRVLGVPRPSASGTVTRDALLVPVEYWDDGMEAAVQAAFPDDAPGVYQTMRVDLGGDGVQFGLIEARQRGLRFSQSLPAEPALLVTNCLDTEDDNRYSKNNKFRRRVHRLSPDAGLTSVGDSFDLAAAPELPAKGVSVEIIGEADVSRPYGLVHVFHVRARVEQADYIDLTFTDNVPNWQSPDIWIDYRGDNDDSAIPRLYPEGEPLDQGETVRPGEDHFVVARVWNKGKGAVTAENVKIRLEMKSPAGAGDADFKKHSSVIIPSVANGDWEPAVFSWTAPNEDHHLCLRVFIEDWEIPVDSGGEALASDDLWVSNNQAQQNVFEFTSAGSSPFDPITFKFGVSNTGIQPERTFLEPEFLPRGLRLRVTPRSRVIPPGKTAIFNCTLTLDEQIIKTGCQNDRTFMLYALRQTAHDLVRWGGCKYVIQPRRRTETTLSGMWSHNFLNLHGAVSPVPGAGPVRLRMLFADSTVPQWVNVDMEAGGTFTFDEETNFPADTELRVQAVFEGNQQFAPSKSKEILLANAVVG